MNFSLPPMILYCLILLIAIVSGMNSKENDQIKTIQVGPGYLGLSIDDEGIVQRLQYGCRDVFKDEGISKEWRVTSISGRPFSLTFLLEKSQGTDYYELQFKKKIKEERSFEIVNVLSEDTGNLYLTPKKEESFEIINTLSQNTGNRYLTPKKEDSFEIINTVSQNTGNLYLEPKEGKCNYAFSDDTSEDLDEEDLDLEDDTGHFNAPNVIEIKGKFGTVSRVNGIYYKSNELHNDRLYYHKQDNSKYIRWDQDAEKWQITDIFGTNTVYAYLPEDFSFPALAANDYSIHIEGKNIVVAKIDIQ